jgi:hypothetical protein
MQLQLLQYATVMIEKGRIHHLSYASADVVCSTESIPKNENQDNEIPGQLKVEAGWERG